MTRRGHYYLWNIGCQMNQAEAWRLSEELERRGYLPTRLPDQADLLILNTCVVRQSAESKVTGRLNSLRPLKRRRDERALLVMGCFVDDSEALGMRYPFVDAFFRPSDLSGVLEFVDRWGGERMAQAEKGTGMVSSAHVADMVPISYGCDRHCTYCVVSLRRGEQKSRSVGEITEGVRALVDRGTRDITLLGQNVDAYGTDLQDRPDLADVLQAVHGLEDLWRIRFLTSHPGDMTQRIIGTVAALPKVCECWELAVQSGDDTTLRRMARGYSAEHFRDLARRIRQAMLGSALNTDIIVGFPGETVEQFDRTLALVREIRFDNVHVAAYSVRPGTAAAAWPDDVSPIEKERRRALIEEVQTEIAAEINAAHTGTEVNILVDGQQRGRWRGRTRTNKLVFFDSPNDYLGRMVNVHVTWTGPWSMIGEVVS